MAKKRKPRKKKLDGGKLFLGAMTGGLSFLATGIHQDPKPRKRRKKKKGGLSYIDDRWCDRASWF